VAERLSAITAALDAFDADLAAQPGSWRQAVDLGRLRGIVRALLPMALEDPTFDVTVTVGPAGTAVRVQHVAGGGPTARLVRERPGERPVGPGGGRHRDSREPAVEVPAVPVAPVEPAAPAAGATAARELADLLRQGGRQAGQGAR
jgi:hypothetical protein